MVTATTNIDSRRVLITGAAGYVGSHLTKLLSQAQVLDRIFGDELSDFEPQLKKWEEIEYVIHLADLRLQDINELNLTSNLQTHREFLLKVKNLPQLKKLIFASSCSVYGFSEQEINDHSAPMPTSSYAKSKLGVEKILKELQIPHLILRFATAYGWSKEMRHDLLINQFAKAAVSAESVEVYSAEAWRPYIHCQDFAHALVGGLSVDESGPLNVVAENFTKRQILNLPAFLKRQHLFKEVPDKDPRNYRVQPTLHRLPQKTTMNEGLTEMMRRYAEHA